MCRLVVFRFAVLASVFLVTAVRAHEIEEKAIKEIERLGGKVIRNETAEGKPVVGVDFFSLPVSDADLKHLAKFPGLKELYLGSTDVTDAGIKELGALKELDTLYLSSTKVTDTALKDLARLKNLKTLMLSFTGVTDTGLQELAGLKQLEVVSLFRTDVTDSGVNELMKALPKCLVIPPKRADDSEN
jgi:Leucine Rich repeat